MDAARKRALRRYSPELRTGFIVNNLLPDLHCDAGGFLTDVESLKISSKSCNVSQVDELIVILLTKENRDFDSFCRVLKKGGCVRWSEKLNQSVSPTKQGDPGGAECPVPCPLIHSIKDDYLKVKDVFCDSPGMPSLDALKDRCDDLIHVAFADEPQISHHESTIRKVETVRELARILFFRLSRWISFDFLDKVVEHFQPELKDVKEQLAQYKEKLRLILMQKLKQISELRRQRQEEMSEGLELAEIVAKYRLDADGLRVQDLVTERDFMAQRLGIPEYLLQVLSWRPGSVIIVFLLLQELRPLVELALRRSDVRAGLISRGVEAIYFDGCSSNLVDRASEHQPRKNVHACMTGTLDSSLSHPGSLVTPSVVECNLKANFEQYSYSHEDSGNQVKELIEEKQKLAEIARDATAKLAVLEQQRLSYDATPAPPRPQLTTSEAASRSVGEEATGVSAQTPIDPGKLVNFLPAMATKWFDIGLKLGCKDTAMELRTSPDPPRMRCFVVIDEWMNNEGESACWEYLCRDVLRSEGVGLGHVADRIEQELSLESSRQVSSQAGGSGDVKNCEIQQLQARVEELEEDREQMVALKQQQINELTAKCVAAEEGRRRAEEGRMEMQREKERLESEFERYHFSQEELIRDLTEEKQQLAETNADTTDRLALLARHRLDMAAELEKLNKQLVAKNAVLNKENEDYSEEVADMRQRMEEMEAEVERLHSVLQWRTSGSGDREPKRTIPHFASSPAYVSEEVLSPDAASLAVKDLLQCDDEEAQNHLKDFFDVMNTSSQHVTYTSGSPYRDWRCLAMHVGLRVSNLQATSSEKRLSIILEEWARMETVTVAKLHEVLIKSQCTRAAGCLAKGSVAYVQSTMNQEEEDS